MANVLVIRELAARSFANDPPHFHYVASIGNAERREDVLLDQKDGHALLADFAQNIEKLVDDDRRQTEGSVHPPSADAGPT